MKFKKLIGSLLVSTMVLGALAPTGSVLASELDNDTEVLNEQPQEVIVPEEQLPELEENPELDIEDEYIESATMFQDENGEWQKLPELLMQPFATRVVVATQTLSVSQVKQLAKNIKTLNGSGSQAVYTLLGGAFGAVWGPIVAAGLIAGAGNQARSVITSAAAKGKRVKITITDYKEYHTSYSRQTKYTIVN